MIFVKNTGGERAEWIIDIPLGTCWIIAIIEKSGAPRGLLYGGVIY